MPATIRFTSSEAWINSVKYLHADGILYKIRDKPRGASTDPWSFNAWKGAPASKTAQAVFERAWTSASPCVLCGCKCDTADRDVCYGCFTAAKIRVAKLHRTTDAITHTRITETLDTNDTNDDDLMRELFGPI